ncbi:MAG: flavin reductase family protein [Chloroflexota bacterium]|nr:flavin reductase family protein [Chloroflexota bacterium]
MKIDFDSLSRMECHDLLVGMIVPRPIAWVSTIGEDGTFNLAPYSFFGAVSSKPPRLCVAIERRRGDKKDTIRNIEYARDFVVNVSTEALAAQMNQSSADYPRAVSEFKETGLTPVASDKVRSPRIAESPISMECKVVQLIEFGEGANSSSLVIGEVVRAHAEDALFKEGTFDSSRLRAIARLSAELYCRTGDVFEMKRPRLP